MVKKINILLFITALSLSVISCKKDVSPLEDVNKDNLVKISMADEEMIRRGAEYIVLDENASEVLLEDLKNISYKKLYFYNPDKVKIDDELYQIPKETYKKFEKYF